MAVPSQILLPRTPLWKESNGSKYPDSCTLALVAATGGRTSSSTARAFSSETTLSKGGGIKMHFTSAPKSGRVTTVRMKEAGLPPHEIPVERQALPYPVMSSRYGSQAT